MVSTRKPSVVPADQSDEIVRILALLLRQQVGGQGKTILELSRAGFAPARIAALLGTTPNTVSQEIGKAKRVGKKSQKKA